MSNIQDSPHPLVFPPGELPASFSALSASTLPDMVQVRTWSRALEGMQKEAVVLNAAHGKAWRMVCDEGPYLNGSDLAPFPLAFFCTGMAANLFGELQLLFREHQLSYRSLKLIVDNHYTMEGSALAGTMRGSALPPDLQLVVDSPAPASKLQALLKEAVAKSPACALFLHAQKAEFSLLHNGKALQSFRVKASASQGPGPGEGFDTLAPEAAWEQQDLIVKTLDASARQGGEAGSSLRADQKRALHVRGICTAQEDGLCAIDIELFRPIGSNFRLLSDPSGLRAPAALDYLCAGVAFCFMTQIGRYATIRKQALADYRLVQDFRFTPAAPAEAALLTHVSMASDYSDDYAQQVLDMSEQTCFLHAACRDSVAPQLQDLCRAIPIIP